MGSAKFPYSVFKHMIVMARTPPPWSQLVLAVRRTMLLTHVLLDTAKYRLNIDSTLINDNPLFNVLCKESIILYKIILYKNNWIRKLRIHRLQLWNVYVTESIWLICLVWCTGDSLLYSKYFSLPSQRSYAWNGAYVRTCAPGCALVCLCVTQPTTSQNT